MSVARLNPSCAKDAQAFIPFILDKHIRCVIIQMAALYKHCRADLLELSRRCRHLLNVVDLKAGERRLDDVWCNHVGQWKKPTLRWRATYPHKFIRL
jgi:hypothetical protein